MRLITTTETGTQIAEEIILHRLNIRDIHYEDWFTKLSENKSYFVVYLNTPQDAWLEIKLSECKQKILNYEMYLNDDYDSIVCELTEQEQTLIVEICNEVLINYN